MRKIKFNAGKTLKILIIEFILSTSGILFGYTYKVYEESKKWDLLIYPGIKIEGIDVGGKTKDESINIIQTKFVDPILKKKSILQASNKSFEMENSKIIEKYDINSSVSKAFEFDKDIGVYQKHRIIKNGINEEYKLDLTFNKKEMNNLYQNIQSEINAKPINANITIDTSGRPIVNDEKEGLKVNSAELENSIKGSFHNNSNKISSIKIPTEKIRPTVTADKLSTINTNISSFSTSFTSSSMERANNIILAASFINGKILMPGEVFSFNDIVGERTSKRGFLEAPVIVDNKIESGFGGGICQVSSTLYNSVLLAGLNATERVHHSLPSSYVKLGMDATVDWNNIDFKFKNTLGYPILIKVSTDNRILKIDLFSNSTLLKKKYSLTNNIYETIDSNTTLVNDSSLALGQNEVIRNSYKGFKVKVIRNTYEDGKFIYSEIISNDYYIPVNGIIKIGVKGK